MSNAVIVHTNVTNTLTVDLGADVSADTITSQVRAQPNSESPLLMEWVVTKVNGGVDGELILTVDDGITKQIVAASGFMDIRRVVNGEPVPVFDKPLEVIFRPSVTTDE